MSAPAKVYVLDTNALLNDPEVVHSFSGAEVVIPAVVLKELDNLKRREADKRIRFHGRKATRLLFEVSKNGHLLDGVRLENGSILRVDATEEFGPLPSDLDLRRSDDQILALAYSLDQEPGVTVTLVTNDLNMLLRGEALGLEAYRFEGKLDQLQERHLRPTDWLRAHRLTVILGLLALIFAVSTVWLWTTRPAPSPLVDLKVADNAAILQALGVDPQTLEKHYQGLLAKNPADLDALVNLGGLLFDQNRYAEATNYYRRALDAQPANVDARTNMGIALLQLGRRPEAVQAFRQVIVEAESYAPAHYNLGLALALNGDSTEALSELQEAISLARAESPHAPDWLADAERVIAELQQNPPQSR